MGMKANGKNGYIELYEDYVLVSVASRTAQIPYQDIRKVDFQKATEKKEGTFDIYSNSSGNLRLRLDVNDNDAFKKLKEDIKDNKKAVISINGMKTAEEMYQYCLDNSYGIGFNEKLALQHFHVIEKNLNPGEYISMVFIGLHNYIKATKHENNHAYAITNRRILIGQKKIIGEFFKAISLDNLNDVTVNTGFMLGVLTFDTIKEQFNVCVNKEHASNILEQLHGALFKFERAAEKSSSSPAEEIRKYKNLLEDGIITQQEFDAKKNQLLNL